MAALVPVCSQSVPLEVLHLSIRTISTSGISVKQTMWQVQTSLRGQVALGLCHRPVGRQGGDFLSCSFSFRASDLTKTSTALWSGAAANTHLSLVTRHIGTKVLPKLFSLLLSAVDLGIFLVSFLSSDAIKMKQYFKSSFCSDCKKLVTVSKDHQTP